MLQIYNDKSSHKYNDRSTKEKQSTTFNLSLKLQNLGVDLHKHFIHLSQLYWFCLTIICCFNNKGLMRFSLSLGWSNSSYFRDFVASSFFTVIFGFWYYCLSFEHVESFLFGYFTHSCPLDFPVDFIFLCP